MNFQDSYSTQLLRTTDSVSKTETNLTPSLKWIIVELKSTKARTL